MGKKPTKVFLDEVYVVACPKSELKYDEKKKKRRERENKRAQLKESIPFHWLYIGY